MPLRNDLLSPIAGDNPSGQNLRYAPVFDKIKEARREDDDAAQGDWKVERKVADWAFVIKTAGETIATKSKDLQLAAWLTEALLKTQGVAGLRDGLDLLKGLIEGFWDTLYPEIEDGDVEMRAAPLDWVGGRLDRAVRDAPLTRGRHSWFLYKESRKVPTEQEAAESSPKAEAREAAVAEGKLTPEEFDKAFESSPKAYYAQLSADFDGALESLQALDSLCEEKFQDVAPGFGPLRQTLEEVQQAIRIFLQKKREKEPDAPVEGAEPEPEAEAATEASWEEAPAAQTASAAPARARKPGGALAAEPVDRDDAIARVVSAARYLRGENQYDPAPYLLLRGLRWGELRAAGTDIDQSLLAAPPSDLRQDLKRLSMEGNWTEVLEAAERGMGMECGRGWLDLQRYVGRACYELGSYHEPIRSAVISGVRGLLADYPRLAELTMMDDTPTANAETQAWLKEYVVVAPAPAEAQYTPTPYQSDDDGRNASAPGAEAAPDTFDLAMQAARSGRPQEGIEMLMREMAQERNGRARFHRKVQLTQLCISTGYDAIAMPILQELAGEIERRKLEDWESPELLAQPLALLYRCLTKADGSAEDRQKLYSWICRLDPLQAMNVAR
jgi:type VI secretion system protein ImpA